jgi:hypothetical protein
MLNLLAEKLFLREDTHTDFFSLIRPRRQLLFGERKLIVALPEQTENSGERGRDRNAI